MRSKILPTLYSIVHGPKKKQETKQTKQQSTCQTKLKRNKHLKVDTYTHMPKRAYNHKFTKLSYVHTNITKLKLNIRHYYVIRKRATTFFCLFFCTFSTPCLSPTHKIENLKHKKQKTIVTVNIMSLPFSQCVRVLPELSQCLGKLSIGTHDSTQTGSYHKSPLCEKKKKKKTCLLHTYTTTHTQTRSLHHAQGQTV